MLFEINNKIIEIFQLDPILDTNGSNYIVKGNKILSEIGLKQTFYFRPPEYFSNDMPVPDEPEGFKYKNEEQKKLAEILNESITNRDMKEV